MAFDFVVAAEAVSDNEDIGLHLCVCQHILGIGKVSPGTYCNPVTDKSCDEG